MENLDTILSIFASIVSIISIVISTNTYYKVKSSTRQTNKNNSGTSYQAGGDINHGDDNK